jgi:hypothetical protein
MTATKKLMEDMNASGRFYAIGAHGHDSLYFIRISVANVQSESFLADTVAFIRAAADRLLSSAAPTS